ncbi:MAG: amino acid adenylation domain-containing protein [Sphaerospermopsis sp. SIO1G1]|nr:amino acid adenylation domain-containing protein [Sphaerospermopsis sp. SIO1G1]
MPYLLHQLLEISAKNYPDVEAIIFKNNSITYQELDTRSEQLANTLRENGLQKGDRVGICLEPSIEEIIAIYGILKAGMVYVPMDAYTPVSRIAFMIENCGITALITAGKILKKLYKEEFINTAINHLQIAIIDDTENINQEQISPTKIIAWQQVLTASATALPPVKLIDSDLSQILYTSGSTGKPKGVMISHRSSLNMANCFYECLQVQPKERISHQFSITFSASIIDIFTSIQAGATIVIVPPEFVAFPVMMANFISEHKINIWSSVPSLLVQLILRGNLKQQNLSSLRMITFAGEVFPIKYLHQLIEIIPHVQYCNNYGSTETGVRTYYLFNQIPPEMTSLPLGKAGHNIDLFVVNDENKIASPGEIGELYARGSSLMKGYWGMPEKTQEVLIPYTLNSQSEAEIVFRTGDLVKQDADGNFVYIGRRDHTIKSRGYRIEIGEIEQVISRHSDIEEVAVIPIPDEQIGNRIKAVVVKKDSSEVTKNKLQYFCSQYLPKYMIPEQIEFRSQLPKTPRGKIDRVLLRESEK